MPIFQSILACPYLLMFPLLAHSRHYPANSTCSVATLSNTLTNLRYPRDAHPLSVNFLHRALRSRRPKHPEAQMSLSGLICVIQG